MAYTRQDWFDSPDTSSPLSADRLNHIEVGVEAAAATADAAETPAGAQTKADQAVTDHVAAPDPHPGYVSADELAATNLNDLADVNTTGATDGQSLVLNAGTGVWGPATVSGGAGGTTDHGALTGLADDDHSTVYPRYTIGASPPVTPRRGDFWLVAP